MHIISKCNTALNYYVARSNRRYLSNFVIISILFFRAFLSGLKTDYGAPHSFSSSIVAMENLKKMVEVWGGGEKGFRMAFTLQKLQAAKLKGMKELEWQK